MRIINYQCRQTKQSSYLLLCFPTARWSLLHQLQVRNDCIFKKGLSGSLSSSRMSKVTTFDLSEFKNRKAPHDRLSENENQEQKVCTQRQGRGCQKKSRAVSWISAEMCALGVKRCVCLYRPLSQAESAQGKPAGYMALNCRPCLSELRNLVGYQSFSS